MLVLRRAARMGQVRMFSAPVDPATYIKEMVDEQKDWDAAMDNTARPVLIQAGASWCGPC
jgi:thiol-disulfide isomerase/thioredoxin